MTKSVCAQLGTMAAFQFYKSFQRASRRSTIMITKIEMYFCMHLDTKINIGHTRLSLMTEQNTFHNHSIQF